ncbi:MAG TPA: sensor histidine kinase, partial [Verrucomicrobiae bacterium]|nr:sensor histidine kinase [Verrucomicrobiae bacterium]
QHLRVVVYPPGVFLSRSEIRSLCTGAFIGICLIVATINMVLAVRLRDRLYAYFSLYVLTHVAGAAGMEGLLPLFWPSAAHHLSDYLGEGGIALGASTFALFVMRLFETRRGSASHRYFLLTCLLGVAGFLAIPLGMHHRIGPLLAMNGLLFISVVTALGIGLVRRGIAAGHLFLTAFTVSNLGSVIAFLRLLGVVPLTWLTLYSLPLGTVLSMVLMTLALTRRVQAAEEKALAASREAEQRAITIAAGMTRELQEKQRKLTEALATEREALDRQVRFVEMVSHEYRTPLAIIRANLDILEMKEGHPRSLSPNIGKMKRAVTRLVEVLEVSLEGGRVKHRTDVPAWEEIDLLPFLKDVVEEAKGLWGGRIVELEGDAEGRLKGDRSLLKTLFLNLIDNAFKYSAEHSTVRVSVAREKGTLAVAVADSGRGIPPGELASVFEKYFRGGGSTDTPGAGIGLYLVRRITQQHGGEITIVSPGAGTVVTVRLPLSVAAAAEGGEITLREGL